MSRLVIDHLSVVIGRRQILSGISFSAEGGTLVGLIGPNGAGKSTLARTIARLLEPSDGHITVDGRAITGMPTRQVARKIAYLAQGDGVHWPLSVRSVVAMGRSPHLSAVGRGSAADIAAVENAMERTGVSAMADRDVTRISGGERARVLLARALAVEAPILVADEPVGALDPLHGLNIMALLREEATRGALVIVVLHDLALASRFCDRLIALGRGRMVADGKPEDVLSPEGIKQHYAVRGHHGVHEGEAFVLPWRPLEIQQGEHP